MVYSICIQIVGHNYTWGNEWIEQYDKLGKQVGKPVILEEYGTPFPYNHIENEAPWYVFSFCFSTLFFFPFQVESVGMRDVDDVANHLSS